MIRLTWRASDLVRSLMENGKYEESGFVIRFMNLSTRSSRAARLTGLNGLKAR